MDDQLVLKNQFEKCAWPKLYYGVVPFLMRGKNPKNIAEIGVAYGYHAHSIMLSLPQVNYFGIDPYLADYDLDDVFCSEVSRVFFEPDRTQAMRRLGDAVAQSLSVYGQRANLIRKRSADAAQQFESGFFDLIFIDGDHTYDGVIGDLNAWWPKVMAGGILCGDDYVSFEGVRTALDEFVRANGLSLKSTEKPGTNYPIWILQK